MKRFYLILGVIIAAIIVLGTVLIINWVQDIPYALAEEADFQATVTDEGGTDISSAFRIVFDEEVSSASVRRYLTVTPEINLGVHQGAGRNEVLIAPAKQLDPGTVYTFTLEAEGKKLSWAFQTKLPLVISEVRPGNEEIAILTSAPIEIVFNQMTAIDQSAVDEYISITPQINYTLEQEGRVLRLLPTAGLSADTVYQVEIKAGLPLLNSDLVLAEDYSFAFETTPTEEALWQISGSSAYLSNTAPEFSVAVPGADEEIVINAVLYQFANAETYAAALLGAVQNSPSWSQNYQNLHALSLNNSSRIAQFALSPENNTITWPGAVGPGYYLLRCAYGEQSKDLLFAVSDISAYMLTDQESSLFWIHDSATDQPLPASVKDIYDAALATANASGIAKIPRERDTVYLIEAEGKSLILPCYGGREQEEANYSNWRYLYLDQSNYQSGDILDFWGMVKPRDNSALEYERVTVMLTSLALGKTVYHDYAALNDYVFSGHITLPSLLAGEYQLEIWQSGKQLVSRAFSVGQTVTASGAQEQAGDSTVIPVTFDQSEYALNSSFLATTPISGSEYLFIESGEQITSFIPGKENSYLGNFAPDNYLNSYLTVVSYNKGEYLPAGPTLQTVDTSANHLQVKASGDLDNEKSGESGVLSIDVKDSQNNPTAAMLAITVYRADSKPQIHTFSDVYHDYVPLTAQDVNSSPSIVAEKLFFATVQADEQGQALCSYQLPEFNGDCWLVVQAIDCSEGQVKAGSIVLEYGSGTAPEPELLPEEESKHYAYDRATLAAEMELATNTELTIFSSPQRADIITLLWQQLFAYKESELATNSVVTAITAAHARQLLRDYASDAVFELTGSPLDLSVYQKQDGGMGDLGTTSSLSASVAAIATAADGVDYTALLDYCQSFLEQSSSRLEKCIAITGMALYNQPVLTEVNLLLANADLTVEEKLWLSWALYALGDKENATQRFAALLTENGNLSAKEAALAAIVSSLTGAGDVSDLLEESSTAEAEGLDALAKVLVARNILPQLLQPEMSFTYSANGQQQAATMAGINDFLLLGDEEINQNFSDISGKIDYINIYRLD